MIEQQPTINNPGPIDPTNAGNVPKNNPISTYWQKIKNIIPEPVKRVFYKFYSNKKVFLPVTAAFSLIVLIIILGLIFGNRNKMTKTLETPAPTPVPYVAPQTAQPQDIITVTESVLKGLKSQIESLDVHQNRLQPPKFDFNIEL